MGSTVIFVCLGLIAIWALWRLRPERGSGDPVAMAVAAALPAALLALLFVSASQENAAQQLRVKTSQLQVPTAGIGLRGPEQIFTVGENAESNDLLVAPFSSDRMSREVMPRGGRQFLTLRIDRSRSKATVDLCSNSFGYDAAGDLPGMLVEIDGELIRQEGQSCRMLAPGSEAKIHIYREDRDRQIADRRELSLSWKGGSEPVGIHLNTPLTAKAGTCNDPRLTLAPARNSVAESDFLPHDDLVMPQLGAGNPDNPFLKPSDLGSIGNLAQMCSEKESLFAWPSAESGSEPRIIFEGSRIFLPWYLVALMALVSGGLYFLCRDQWMLRIAEPVAVFALQWLLALRAMIGVEGVYSDGGLSASAVLWDVAIAYVALPIGLIAMLRPGGEETQRLVVKLAMILGSATVAVAIWLGDFRGSTQPIILVAIVAAVLAIRWKLSDPRPIASYVAEHARHALLVFRLRFEFLKRMRREAYYSAGLALLILLFAVRIGFLLLGFVTDARFAERAFGVAFSIFHVPLAIVGFAMLIAGYRARPSLRRALGIAGAFIAIYFVVALAVRDFGMIFLFAWPVAAVIAVTGQSATKRIDTGRWQRLLAHGALIVPLLLPFGIFAISFLLATADIPRPTPENLGEHLAAVEGWDGNEVRLLRFAAPDKVEQLGTKHAFEILEQAAALDPLGRDLVGHGYLEPSYVRAPLIDYQFSDNLSAVHIMWPFGRLGLLAVLAFYALLAFSLWPEHARGREPEGPERGQWRWQSVAAAMALVTLAWSAFYMALANLNMVPFTGRNFYLLAATSVGDLIEGGALLLIACLPLLPASSWHAANRLAAPEGSDEP